MTTDGSLTVFSDPAIGQPLGITSGPDGALWFTQRHSVGRITTSGSVTTFTDPSMFSLTAIATGPDGALWYTDTSSIGRITTSGVVSTFTATDIGSPGDITTGPDGNLWFTNGASPGAAIWRITPAGVMTKFSDPHLASPHGITVGPDGNLWFTNSASIGRITPSGAISVFSVAAGSAWDIATGPDGDLWITGQSNVIRFRVLGSPGQPLMGVTTPFDAAISVSWAPPALDGGSAITGYLVTATPGGATCGWSSGPLTCTLTGLTNDIPYSITVSAVSDRGRGIPSSPSQPVTPRSSFGPPPA